MLDWNGIRDFLAIVEAGTITRAATTMRISQPTLSRRLCALEDQVGVKLLIRGPRHMELTEAGQRILDRARRMAMEAKTVRDAARDASDQLDGTVRISATEGFAGTWLTEQLSEFMALYPKIVIELIADNRLTDLLSRDADIAIRLVKPTQKGLFTRRVASLRIGFYASADYIEINGAPRRHAELDAHRVIGLVGRRQFPQDIDAAMGARNAVLRTKNLHGVFTAVQAGIGIGPLYRYLGDREPNLVRVLRDEPEVEREVWLTAVQELDDNARVRALYDYLVSAFVEQRPQLSGKNRPPAS